MSQSTRPKTTAPEASREAYGSLTSYAFARRYVAGKSAAHISQEYIGYGTGLLAEAAGSVVGLTESSDSVEEASSTYPAPNVSYERTDLPKLPRPDGSFDVVVAQEVFGNLEDPDELLREVKRVLKPNGILLAFATDKDRHVAGREYDRRKIHGAKLQEFLKGKFRHVRLYRLGAVAGGIVFADGKTVDGVRVESASFFLSQPFFRAGASPTCCLIAVCSDTTASDEDVEDPYLLLDRDLRVFEESEDLFEDLDLLRDEVRRMQESEVQAFQDTLTLRGSEVNYFKTRLERSEANAMKLGDQIKKLSEQNAGLREQLREIHSSRAWRLLNLYRRLRARSGTGR